MGTESRGVSGTGPGGSVRSVVLVDRLVRRGRFEGRPIECIVLGSKLDEMERVATFSIDSGISFRKPGDFATVYGLVTAGALSREAFMSHYSATSAFSAAPFVRARAVSLGVL